METYFHIRYEFEPHAVHRGIAAGVHSGKPGYICVADGNILAQVHRDPAYRATIDGALFSVCDSAWVPTYLRWLYGIRRRPYCGAQLFADIVSGGQYSMAFLGTDEPTLAALKRALIPLNPAVESMPFIPLPYAARAEEFDYPAIAAQLALHAPDIIWVALGAPKQEQFAQRLALHLPRGIIIGVGAAFNFISGRIRRAPRWVQRCKAEFLYRLLTEPRKQLHRCWHIATTLPRIYHTERAKAQQFSVNI